MSFNIEVSQKQKNSNHLTTIWVAAQTKRRLQFIWTPFFCLRRSFQSTFLSKIKPIILGKIRFEDCGIWKSLELPENFELPRFWYEGQSIGFCNWIIFCNWNVFDWDFDGINQTIFRERKRLKFEFSQRSLHFFFQHLSIKTLPQGRNQGFSIWISFNKNRAFDWDLVEKIKSCIFGEKQILTSSKFILFALFDVHCMWGSQTDMF